MTIHRRTLVPAVLSLVLVVGAVTGATESVQDTAKKKMPPASAKSGAAATLKQDMRKLWTDHVVWTRDYIIAAVGDQPDATAAAGRLMKNQEDIGNAVAKFYGAPAG